MKKLLVFLLAFVCFAVASTDPVIAAHPRALVGGSVLGANFGTRPGALWIRPVVFLNDATRAAGITESNSSRVWSSMEGSNRIAVPVKKWGDVTIAYSFTASERNNIEKEVVIRAADKGFAITENDFDFKFQVERPDGVSSEWF